MLTLYTESIEKKRVVTHDAFAKVMGVTGEQFRKLSKTKDAISLR